MNAKRKMEVFTEIWMKARGELLLYLKTPLLDIFMRTRMTCPCKCRFPGFTSTYQTVFTISIYSPLTLTNHGAETPFPGTKWKCVITYSTAKTARKTHNGNAAIDKFIMQSARTNSRFHHLAHQQLCPMNYLLAALLLACPLLLMW